MMRSTRIRASALYVCFLISGVAGLIYEILWAKYLALFLGSTGWAQVIVLATFMGGLALGSHFLGSRADRVANPLKFYVFLELAIGCYALVLFKPALAASHWLFIELARFTQLGSGNLIAAKVTASVLSIILPTFLMGGTLPTLGRHMVRSLQGVGPKIARLYFLNSLGGVVGCLLAGFYLIQALGLEFSMITAGMLSILAGLIAFATFPMEEPAPETTPEPDMPNATPGPSMNRWAVGLLLACVSLSGAVSMMYEVAWIRLLTLVLGSSTYSFSLMLATFILGLSLGGLLLSLRKRTTGYGVIFGLSEVGVALTVLIMLPFYMKLPYLFNQLASSLSREPSTFALYQLCKFFLCALVMIIPTILQGVTLPAATKLLTPNVLALGRRVGLVFAINTIGTVIGVVFAGFWGLPNLGIKGTLELAVALNALVGIAVLLTNWPALAHRRALALATACLVIVGVWYMFGMGPWDKQVLSAGIYRTRQRIPSYASLVEEANTRRTVFYRDGIDATIAVQDVERPIAERILVINGKVDASTKGDLATQKMIGHLPLMIKPQTDQVLIVGVGSGATIGSVLAHDVQQVEVVEISRDIIEASRLFETVNGRYWEDPRAKVYWEDAKTFLQLTDRHYDTIISQPTNPWIAGVAGVFSKEYFEACRQQLKPSLSLRLMRSLSQ